MKLRTYGVLLATLVSTTAWGQEVSTFGTTLAQLWKQDPPGFEKGTYAPVTQYLGIDATNLGSDAFSLHLFGWGKVDAADSTNLIGLPGGELTYGYLQYRLPNANAEIKAGRFTINQGVGIEQVDGFSARADLRNGFTLSAFGGKPVLYKRGDYLAQKDYEYQRNIIFGGRLGLRVPKVGEFGISVLQDGSKPAKDLPVLSTVDYTRKQVGFDLRIAPNSTFDFYGRTIYDLASHLETPGLPSPSKIAENDYTLAVKVMPTLAFTGNFTERNFQAYFAGTNLPSLFKAISNKLEQDKQRAFGASVIWGSATALEVIGDFRRTHRESYGNATRFGGEVRWNLPEQKLQSGFGFHRVTADDALKAGSKTEYYGLSYRELRAYVMCEHGKLSLSLDGINHTYDDANNPQLNGKTSLSEVVASAGYQTSSNLKLGADLSYGVNAFFTKEVRAILRAEFRFATGSKGGSK